MQPPVPQCSLAVNIVFDITFFLPGSAAINVQRSHWAVRLVWLMGIAAIALPSCSPTQAAAPCDRLQKSLYSAPPTAEPNVIPIDRATTTYIAKQQAVRADQLAQMPILNAELSARRNELMALYRQDSELGLQIASFMGAGGAVKVSGSNRTAYEQIANQRIAINQQMKEQIDAINGYCSKQIKS